MTIEKEHDYIIVGTGPGGATVAKELAAVKKRVLMVEYGPRLSTTGYMKVARKAFIENNRLLRSEEGIWIGRARILGGSSYVAMGNAVTPPNSILDEWGIDLSRELEYARKNLRVNLIPDRFIGPATMSINRGAASLGWEQWIGSEGTMISIDRFGASAPYEKLFEEYGFTVDNVLDKARFLLQES